ncbi:hypothetical protein Hdeb2414_s0005g00174481 [Helianthus debilis subsp. tardiflorus]
MFRRRFRMSCRLFLRIADDLPQSDPFLHCDTTLGAKGDSLLCINVRRPFANWHTGTHPIRWMSILVSERTAWECLHRFCEWIVKLYRKKYLRKPNANDVQKLYQAHEQRHVFQECSEALIACTGRGRTSLLPVNILGAIMVIQL